MTNANKAKGSAWETDVRKFLRTQGLDVEPLRQLGSMDEGDLVVRAGGKRFILEAKNRARIDLPQFMREAQSEAVLYAENRELSQCDTTGVAVVKARRKPVKDGYVVMTMADFPTLCNTLTGHS